MDAGFPTPRANYTGGNQAASTGGDAEMEKDTSPLRWWYHFTAPPPVAANASLQEREIARRGRLTSATLLVVILLVLAAEPIAFLGKQQSLIIILLIPVVFYIFALIFNRRGQITTAGILTIIGMEVGIVLATLGQAAQGGLTTFNLPQYDLLVQAEFVAVTLLPPASVFFMVFLHSAFIFGTVLFMKHSPDFAVVLTSAANEYGVFLRPLTLQIIVAVVTYLWVTSAYQALRRADRAEVIAELEHREAERQQQEVALKQQLDEGIQQILNTHIQVANG